MTGADIEVRGVTQRFGGLTAVSDVDLEIGAGTVHGIIGPNGAGKTTLLNILSGLQRPTSGQIKVDGRDVTGWRPNRLVTKAGMVRSFQTVRLFASMTVEQNVHVAARTVSSHKAAAARVADVLTRLQLNEVAAEKATNLSYGLQRRVELARLLVVEPRVMLLDEPAAGLSPHERKDLAVLLEEVAGAGVTVVLVEHHMDLVHAVCRSCSVLNFGEVLLSGTPGEVTKDERVLEAYLGRRHQEVAAAAAAETPEGDE